MQHLSSAGGQEDHIVTLETCAARLTVTADHRIIVFRELENIWPETVQPKDQPARSREQAQRGGKETGMALADALRVNASLRSFTLDANSTQLGNETGMALAEPR